MPMDYTPPQMSRFDMLFATPEEDLNGPYQDWVKFMEDAAESCLVARKLQLLWGEGNA